MIRTVLTLATLVLLSQSLSDTICLAQTPHQNVSTPTFDCSKVVVPLPTLLCSSESAASADWEITSAYWALFFSLEPATQAGFRRAHDEFFKSLTQNCALPNVAISFQPSPAQVTCVVTAYRNRANGYRARLAGDALAEANLSPQRHKQIQDALIALGFLSGKSEGVFGSQTRAAIKAFQSNRHFVQSDFLTADQRQLLFQQSEKAQAEKRIGEPVSSSAKPGGSDTAPSPAAPPAADQPRMAKKLNL
jgi:Putative peptidoglycan binding domain